LVGGGCGCGLCGGCGGGGGGGLVLGWGVGRGGGVGGWVREQLLCCVWYWCSFPRRCALRAASVEQARPCPCCPP
jgi:hypothetical protein